MVGSDGTKSNSNIAASIVACLSDQIAPDQCRQVSTLGRDSAGAVWPYHASCRASAQNDSVCKPDNVARGVKCSRRHRAPVYVTLLIVTPVPINCAAKPWI